MTEDTDTDGIPYGARILYWEAVQLIARGDHHRAIQYLGRAVTIAPSYVKAWREMGNCNLRLGRFWEAVSSYDKALSFSGEYSPLPASGPGPLNMEPGKGEDDL